MTHSNGEGLSVKNAKPAAEEPRSSDNLSLLYQGLFTGIVRLQARRQHITDAESFRRRTKASLHEIERVAVAAGYETRDITDTHFAIVAFLDSVVLNSNEPVRAEWERKTLQEELFGQTDAGVVFFEKLEHLLARRDSEYLADLLEVYLLCLLLGFEGRYCGRLRGELDVMTERAGRRIESIRGRKVQISPAGSLPPGGAPAAPEQRPSNRLRTAAVAAVIFTVLLFLFFYWNLSWVAGQVRGSLL